MMKLDEKQIIQLFIAKLKQNNLKDFGQNDVTVIPPERLSGYLIIACCSFQM